MRLFGKKEKENREVPVEENVEEKISSGSKKRLNKKDFKDISPENKKSRREPKKPWGNYERLFVLFVLGLTVGISVYMWFISSGGNFPKMGIKIPNFFKEETIIIDGTD